MREQNRERGWSVSASEWVGGRGLSQSIWMTSLLVGLAACSDPTGLGPHALGGGTVGTADAVISCGGASKNVSTSTNDYEAYGCGPWTFPGTEWKQLLVVDIDGDVVVSASNFDWYPFIVIVRDAGGAPNPADCVVGNYYSVRFSARAGETYWILVDQDGAVPSLRFDVNVDCAASTTETECGDGYDNDNDLQWDCQDPDCGADPACDHGTCQAWGSAFCGDTLVGGSTSEFGSSNVISTYGCYQARQANSAERAYTFDAEQDGWVNFTVSNFSQYPMLFVLADEDGTCNPNTCLAHDYYSVSFYARAGTRYYLVADGWGGTPYTYEYSLICDPPATESSCGNDVDDDGDTWIDCADDDCQSDPACNPGGTCSPLAALDCSTLQLSGDTSTGAASMGSYSCNPTLGVGGPENAYQLGPFSRNQRLLITLSDMSGYGLITVLEDQGAGCDPGACVAQQYYSLSMTARRNTTYYVVVEGDFGGTVAYDISVICDPPGNESGVTGGCSNGIDDDGDYAIDCLDPDCDSACAQPGTCSATAAIDCATTLLPGTTADPGATSTVDSYACYPATTMAGAEVTYTFVAPTTGWVLFTLSNETDYGGIAVLERGVSCDPNECVAFQLYSTLAYLTGGRTYDVVVDGLSTGTFDYDLSVRCNPPTIEDDCGNQIDDDGDFAIDCDDPDCGC